MKQSRPGIYIHIPFCHSKCGYCDFYSVTDLSYTSSFIKALINEIEITAVELKPDDFFDTIYFGGGTPSLLTFNQLEKILDGLKTHFHLHPELNITLEANPGTLTVEKLKEFHSLGVNRISIGVQSFIDQELKLLNRIHTAQESFEAFNFARAAGFDDISIDLIFAIPDQSLKDWSYSLAQAVELKPEHISVYNLTYEKGTPFYRDKQNGKFRAMNEEEELLFYCKAIEYLKMNNFLQYEVSNFAVRPEMVSRHNTKYWDHSDYLGFGPSAHSFWNDKRWSNSASIGNYIKKLKDQRYPDRFEEIIDKKTKEFEKIFLSLRMTSGLKISEFNELFQSSFIQKYKNEIDKLVTGGFALINGDSFILTAEGLYICDEIISNFAHI